MFTGLFTTSAFSLTAPHPISLSHQPKDDSPVIILSRGKDVCIYFLSHHRPFVNVIALVWYHTFQLQKIVSF